MKKKKGFTLVELLAVIVILAVILIIAVPRITDVIKNAKKSSMEDSAKLIATQAEKQWLINQTLSPSDPGYVDLNSSDVCSKVSKYNSSDYQSCSLRVNDNGQITSFSMTGKGKFAGLKCTGTSSNNITCSESDTSLPEYLYSFGDLEKTLIYEIGSGCMDYAENNLRLSHTDATLYCDDVHTRTTPIMSIQKDISNETKLNNLINFNVIVPEYEVGSGCMDYARNEIGLSQTEAAKYCNKEEVIDPNHIFSIQKDIDMGGVDWLIENNVIKNVVKNGDTITSWEVGEGCMDFATNDWLSETEATKYCNKEEAYETHSIQQDIEHAADLLIENNVITNVVKDGDTVTSWEVASGCMDFMKGWLSETEATKYCNKEEVPMTVSIQQQIRNSSTIVLINSNVIKLKYGYNRVKEDYTTLKSSTGDFVEVFIRWPGEVTTYTDDNQLIEAVKSVCTLYGGDIHCFEAGENNYNTNKEKLKELFQNGTCTGDIAYQESIVDKLVGIDRAYATSLGDIICKDGDWNCLLTQDGLVQCNSLLYNCQVGGNGIVYCASGK